MSDYLDGKAHMTLSVNRRIKNIFMEKYEGKASGMIEEFMRNQMTQNIDDYKKEVLYQEIKEMKGKIKEINSQLSQKEIIYSEIGQKEKALDKIKIEEEEKIIAAQESCDSCGNRVEDEDKLRVLKGGKLCSLCYNSLPHKIIKKYL